MQTKLNDFVRNVAPLKGPKKQWAANIYAKHFGQEGISNMDIRAVMYGFTAVPGLEYHTCNIRCNAKCPMYDPVKALKRGYETNWPECARCSGHADAKGKKWTVFAGECGYAEGKPVFYSLDWKTPMCLKCFMKYVHEGDTWPSGEDPDDDPGRMRTRLALQFNRIGMPYQDIVDSWSEPDYCPLEEEFCPADDPMDPMGFQFDDEIAETDDCGYCGGEEGKPVGCAECNNAIRREYRERYPRGLIDEIPEFEPEWLGQLYEAKPKRIEMALLQRSRAERSRAERAIA